VVVNRLLQHPENRLTKAALDLARDQLGYAELHAEFDGIVTAVGAEAGQVVSSGRMIARVAQQGEKDAVFAIAESVFTDGRPAGERPEIVVALLSNSNVMAEGVVREISPVADPVTRTYQVRVALKDPLSRCVSVAASLAASRCRPCQSLRCRRVHSSTRVGNRRCG
jgi:multidrug efflux pump subunit AcrA (membrane-fusion protein)